MKKARVAELKARLSEYLRSVRQGHEVTIFDRDTAIARIVPFETPGRVAVRKPTRRYRNLGEVRMPPPADLSVDAVDVLLEDRRSEERRLKVEPGPKKKNRTTRKT